MTGAPAAQGGTQDALEHGWQVPTAGLTHISETPGARGPSEGPGHQVPTEKGPGEPKAASALSPGAWGRGKVLVGTR